MRGWKKLWVIPAVMVLAAACTQSSAEATPLATDQPSATRSAPVQPPTNPFDLVSTIFPATVTPAESATPAPTPTNPLANVLRATPTRLVRTGPDEVLFDVGVFDPSLVFDGESLWFTDGPFAKRFLLAGELTGTFQVARSDPPQLAFAAGHIWALDAGEGQLRKVTLEGQTVKRVPAALASNMAVAADSIFVYSRTADRMTRYDFEGETIGVFDLDASVYAVTDDRIWVWNFGSLAAYSYEGELLTEWPTAEFKLLPDLQVSGNYAWLFGTSQSDFVRIDIGTGEAEVFELELNDGEFIPGVSSSGGLVLGDSVWVAYMRTRIPPNQPGTISSNFRRIEVFDLDGNVLGSREVGGQILDNRVRRVLPLGEVWMVLAGSPSQTLFRRFRIEDFVPISSRFTPEQLADPVFPDRLDPDLVAVRPDEQEIFDGWREFLADTELVDVRSGLSQYHLCADGRFVVSGAPLVQQGWDVERSPALPSMEWWRVKVSPRIGPVSLDLQLRDGSIFFRAIAEMAVKRSQLCLQSDG